MYMYSISPHVYVNALGNKYQGLSTHVGHQRNSDLRTSAERPAEEEYEYDYVIISPLHVAGRVNPSRRAEGSSIPLNANVSYNVII